MRNLKNRWKYLLIIILAALNGGLIFLSYSAQARTFALGPMMFEKDSACTLFESESVSLQRLRNSFELVDNEGVEKCKAFADQHDHNQCLVAINLAKIMIRSAENQLVQKIACR